MPLPILEQFTMFLSFGKKVDKRSVPQEIKNIFKDVSRVEEQCYFNYQTDETYQVSFAFDQNGSQFSIWMDENLDFYRYEGFFVTTTGKHTVKESSVKLTKPQIVEMLKLPTVEKKYLKILQFGNISTYS